MKKLNIALGLALACSLGTAHAAFSPSADSSYYDLRAHFDAKNYPFEMQENKYYTATMDFKREFSNIDYVCFTPTFKESGAPHVRLYNKTEVSGYSRGDSTTSGQRRCSGSSKFAESFKDGKVKIEFKARDFDKNNTPTVTLKDLIITVIGKTEANSKYEINTCDQLIDVLESRNNQHRPYTITKNLNCNGSKFLDTQGNIFSNFELDGKGHTISNLNIKGSIFDYIIHRSTIQNLKFINPYFEFPVSKVNPHYGKSYVFSREISHNSLVSNISIKNPTSNSGHFKSVIESIDDSEVRNFTLLGNGLKFQGNALFTRAILDSIVSDINIQSVKHDPIDTTSGSLFAYELRRSNIFKVTLKDIDVNWIGKDIDYSFLIKRFDGDNTVDTVQYGNISYPPYYKRITMFGNEYLYDETPATKISNVIHDFWSAGDYPLFPLYWNINGNKNISEQLNSEVKPRDDVEAVLPPAMCAPYIEADKFYSLRVEQQ